MRCGAATAAKIATEIATQCNAATVSDARRATADEDAAYRTL